MKKWFLFVLICNISPNLIAQKCDDFSKLYGTVIKEFPEASYDKPTKDRKLFDRISYNLISDKHFLPIGKKSFVDLSEKEVEKLKKKLFKCTDVNGCWQLRDYLYQIFLSSNFSVAKSNVKRIRTQRVKFNETKTYLKDDLSFEELVKQEKSINSNFGLLTTIEINEISDLINSKKVAAADKDLLLKKDYISSLPDNFSSLSQLDDFKYNNSQLYKYASSIVKTELGALIENKKQQVLESLADFEKEKLENTRFEISDIETVNKVFVSLKDTYRKYDDYNSVKSIYEHYKKKKTYFISTNAYEIANKAEDYYTVRELDGLYNQYLSNTNLTPNIEKLDDFITSRKERIQKYLREKEEERRRKELARENLIKENRALVARKRKELKIKHESNLPTFDELHYILQSYLKLINIDGKYNVDDANDFIRLVENKGYMRKRTTNISSDDETFENGRGFTIEASAFGSFDSEHLAFVSLSIPKASKELIQLYKLELTSGFRGVNKTSMNPSEIPQNDDFFLNSGRTIYNLKVDERGTLIATANRNTDAHWPIICERTNQNTLKVSSFCTYSDLYIKEGQTITLKVSGRIKVGAWAGYSGPNGINGYTNYNKVRRYKHGALLGKIGKDGEWFLIGGHKSIIAQKSGRLYVTINDIDINNNEGYYEINHSFD